MYNLLIAGAAGLLTFAIVTSLLGWVAAVLPALLVFGLALFALARRTNQQVDAALAPLAALLQARDVDGARKLLNDTRTKYGQRQLLLDRQLDAQLGMLDYLQMKFDEALPRLERGRFQNWTAQVCVAAIHYRKGRHAQAWEWLTSAEGVAPKEAIIYVLHAVLRTRAGERAEALEALDRGLKVLPDHDLLKRLHKDIANKRKVRVEGFPESWYQFFPEDFVKDQVMRGRRGTPPAHQAAQAPRPGARAAPRR